MVDITPPTDDFYAFKPASVECVVQAAAKQNVPANVLLAIASIESGKNGQVVSNTNGTSDISHFQINTATYKAELAPHGVTLHDLQWRGCYNAEMAAYLLSKRLNERGAQDFWTKAANYHSKTQKYNAIYREKLVPLSAGWANWLKASYSVNISYR
jgi:soluble lytic murein transglycosylase-like protein